MAENNATPDHTKHPFYIFGSGVVLGVTACFAVVTYFNSQNSIAKESIESYLAEQNKKVITAEVYEQLTSVQPPACVEEISPGPDACLFELEAVKKELEEAREKVEALTPLVETGWSYTVNSTNTGNTKCTRNGKEYGEWHNCSSDGTCGDEQSIKLLCYKRYNDAFKVDLLK